ncbi:MAG: hypothetical protein ACRDHD_01175 [Candidatus Limnocylindria bacterium]
MSHDRDRAAADEHFPIGRFESVEGARTPSSGGERLMIGLAGLVLAGGLLIAVANMIPDRPGVSAATPDPSAVQTAQPSRTPRPTRSPAPLREVTVEPGTPPRPAPQPVYLNGWIRAETDLVVRSRATDDGREVGILGAGQVAYVESPYDASVPDPGWVQVVAPAPSGWVRLGIQELLQLRGVAAMGYASGDIHHVATDGDRFLAVGWKPDPESGSYAPFLARSDDGGASWSFSDPPGMASYGFENVAHGPAGWLSVVQDFDRSPAWIWRSGDAEAWEPVGALASLGSFGWAGRLVGSDLGYLMEVPDGRISQGGGGFWFSTDGRTWLETADRRLSRDAWPGVAANGLGFYIWDAREQVGGVGAPGAFMADGRNWVAVEDGPTGPAAQVVAVGDRLLGIDAEPARREVRVWVGTVDGASLSWERDAASEALFRGAAVSALASDGQRAAAFGWDRLTEATLGWSSDGATWSELAVPEDGFGGIPRHAAMAAGRTVVVGARPALGSTNPVFWRQTSAGSWVSERSPIVPHASAPSPADCGSPPEDAFEFITLPAGYAVACFGDQPFTFRAWSVKCDGCYGGGGGPGASSWLQDPGLNVLYLAPLDVDSGPWSNVVVSRELTVPPGWDNVWLEVTGHYDDPAARDCRSTQSLEEELSYYAGREATIEYCRLQFVVTAVAVVDGP